MRTIVAFGCLILPMSSALGQQMQERQTISVGPWSIATTYKAEKFESCTMSRSASGLGISFIRNQDGLLLNLDSTKWKLERGNAYTVRLAAGSQSVDAKALAETKGVTIAFADRSFNENLGKHTFLKSEERATRFASRWTGAPWRSTVLKRASRKMVVRAERLIRSLRPVGGRRLPKSVSRIRPSDFQF